MFSRFTRGAKKEKDVVSDSELSSEDDEELGGNGDGASGARRQRPKHQAGEDADKEPKSSKKTRKRSKASSSDASSVSSKATENTESRAHQRHARSKASQGASSSDDDDDDNPLLRSPSKKMAKGSKQKSKSKKTPKSPQRQRQRRLSTTTAKEQQAQALRTKEEEDARRREAASRQLISGKELAIRVDKRDLESRHSLRSGEARDFVAVPVLDETPLPVCTNLDVYSAVPVYERRGEVDDCRGRVLVPQRSSRPFGAARAARWREEVFVEDPVAGRFQRVLFELDESGRRVRTKGRRTTEEEVAEHSPQRLRSLMDHLEYVLEGVFMVGQGLLSGGSLFQVIVVSQLGEAETLLSVYGPLASEVRRMFFFLSVFSFVGVCDKLTAQRNQKQHWAERSPSERLEMLAYWAMFFCCLITSLLTWPLVDEISEAYDVYTDGDGTSYVLATDFAATMSTWEIVIGLRFGFAALGWLLVCKDTNRDLLRGRKRFAKIDQYELEIEAGREQLARYTGKQLDAVPLGDLEALQKTLATGLEEVRLQLHIRSTLA